jgi:hypothetical protein
MWRDDGQRGCGGINVGVRHVSIDLLSKPIRR